MKRCSQPEEELDEYRKQVTAGGPSAGSSRSRPVLSRQWCSTVRAEAGRRVALFPGLPRTQRHHAMVCGAAAARRPAPSRRRPGDSLARRRAGGARFFTKLDLAMAYMQLRIREDTVQDVVQGPLRPVRISR